MAGDEFARVLVEFPHCAGDDPQGLAHVLEVVRGAWPEDDYARLEAHFRELEARVARAQRIVAARAGVPPWTAVWGGAFSVPFEHRGHDDPTQLASLSRHLPQWREVTDEDGDWTLSSPLSEDHLCVGLAAIAEMAGFFAAPVTTLDPSDPAQRPRIGRTIREIADLSRSLLMWFEAGEEEDAK